MVSRQKYTLFQPARSTPYFRPSFLPGAVKMSMPGATSTDEISTPHTPTSFNEDDEMAAVNDLSHSTQGNNNVCSDDNEMTVEKDVLVSDAAGQHTCDEAQTP